jgi:membrane protease YdiL (CAAX protease family)
MASLGRSSEGPALSGKPGSLLIVGGVELLLFGIIFAAAWFASRVTWDDLLFRWRKGILPVLSGIGYSVALRVAVVIFIATLSAFLLIFRVVTPETLQEFFSTNQPDVESIVDITAIQTNPLYFWLTVTFVSFILAGLREELWRSAFLAGARGTWPAWFSSRTGQIGAAAIAAVIFGIGHLPLGTLAVGVTGLLGFGLGLIMIFHRSIWPAIIAHGMFDASTMIMLAFKFGGSSS